MFRTTLFSVITPTLALLAGCALAIAQPPQFERDVLPIFQAHCIDCHGADEHQSQLRLDSMLGALRGGDSGEKVIVPGSSDGSHLIERITSDDAKLRMPPSDKRLTQEEIHILRQWIDHREAWAPVQQEIDSQRSTHWSFQPLANPTIPDVSLDQAVELRTAIDAFISHKLASQGLEMSPVAARAQQLRRLKLVMHGLPPSPEEIEAYVNDDRVDAWQRVVDRVLASPRMGERWAMHWLDLIRFGETNGFETNRERPHAWPYRDWVVTAINSDKPYDQFVKQQLAGDSLGDPVATGFLVAGPNDIVKGQDQLLGLMQRQDELADIVNTTGTTFLGMTIGCARCHNHKFDPITQRDYYAMQAMFAGVEHANRSLPMTAEQSAEMNSLQRERQHLKEQLVGWTDEDHLREQVSPRENLERCASTSVRFVRFTIEDTSGSEPCIDELEIYAGNQNVALASLGSKARSSGDFEHPLHKLQHINDGQFGNARSWIASMRRGGWVEIEFPQPHSIDRIVWSRDRQEKYIDRVATRYRIEGSLDGQQWQLLASSADRRPYRASQSDKHEFDLERIAAQWRPQAKLAIERLNQLDARVKEIKEMNQVYAGSFQARPPVVHRLFRGDPTSPRESVAPGVVAMLGRVSLAENAPEAQRRQAVAEWITDANNPLTSRVLVNRLWQFHFGVGIVDTPSDFGASGTPPSHPELLDWLAIELMRGEWSTKRIHRLLLTSHTWQQSSLPNSVGMQRDAASRWLWRYPPRRLEAEALRDSMLSVSGVLDMRIGGAGFSAFEVELENVRHYHPKQEFGPVDWRRMLYMTKVRQEKDAVFGLFDCPDASQVTPKRSRSTTPLQALNLLNSRFVMQQAEYLAQRLERLSDNEAGRVDQAYRLCFGRHAEPDESAAALDFIKEHGWQQFARVILNSNEFVFVP